MREMIARHLGAMKKAAHSLRRYYEDFPKAVANVGKFGVRYPYACRFTSLFGLGDCRFNYTRQMDDKLVFFGRVVPGDSAVVGSDDPKEELCVKFVRRYSKEAHQICASELCAPRLRGFESLPGGWFMVVMDAVNKDFVELHQLDKSARTPQLREQLEAKLTSLHQAGYVHGDVRDTNVMVREDGQGFMLVDFDWSGEIGTVTYPMNIIRGPQLQRPDGAADGQLITPDHDISMLGYMFS